MNDKTHDHGDSGNITTDIRRSFIIARMFWQMIVKPILTWHTSTVNRIAGLVRRYANGCRLAKLIVGH